MRDLDFCQFPSKEQKKESYRTSCYSLSFFFFYAGKFHFPDHCRESQPWVFFFFGGNGAKGHGNAGKQKGGGTNCMGPAHKCCVWGKIVCSWQQFMFSEQKPFLAQDKKHRFRIWTIAKKKNRGKSVIVWEITCPPSPRAKLFPKEKQNKELCCVQHNTKNIFASKGPLCSITFLWLVLQYFTLFFQATKIGLFLPPRGQN